MLVVENPPWQLLDGEAQAWSRDGIVGTRQRFRRSGPQKIRIREKKREKEGRTRVPRAQTSAGGSMGGLLNPSTNCAKATSGAQLFNVHPNLRGSVPALCATEDAIRKPYGWEKSKLTVPEIKYHRLREGFGTSDHLVVGSKRITRRENISR